MRRLTEGERELLKHVSMWGSDGYPIRRLGSRHWGWGDAYGVKGPPTVFKTKREAVASFERFYDVLLEINGEEARERYLAEHPEPRTA